jgi:hypothetical protein
MRSHGVPNYPDPDSGGSLPKTDAQQLGVSSLVLRAATTACWHLLPGNAGSVSENSLLECEDVGACPQALVQRVVSGMRSFAQCMRSHGVANWPDPTVDSEGRPYFNLVPLAGNWRSAQIDSEMNECQHVMPGGVGVPLHRPA